MPQSHESPLPTGDQISVMHLATNTPNGDALSQGESQGNIRCTDDISAEVHTKPAKTLKAWLNKAVHFLKSHNDESGSNSDYQGFEVPLRYVQEWTDFPTAQEMLDQMDAESKEELERLCTEHELDKIVWGVPVSGGSVTEQAFERVWVYVKDGVNLVLKTLAARIQGNFTPEFIVIGDGQCARKKAPEVARAADLKRADLAGYKFVPGSGQYRGNGPDNVFNRIPGDAKLFRKIRHSMLPPNGAEFLPERNRRVRDEAQKVCNQIYDYMDMHEARHGYIVNDEELIFFRRKGEVWGLMEVGPPIRHDVEGDMENGICNSKWVYLYFHHVVANGDESVWRLPSCRGTAELREQPKRRAKAPRQTRTVERFNPVGFKRVPGTGKVNGKR